eukprot:363761-Chlamydomonas_euryale.AAC.32
MQLEGRNKGHGQGTGQGGREKGCWLAAGHVRRLSAASNGGRGVDVQLLHVRIHSTFHTCLHILLPRHEIPMKAYVCTASVTFLLLGPPRVLQLLGPPHVLRLSFLCFLAFLAASRACPPQGVQASSVNNAASEHVKPPPAGTDAHCPTDAVPSPPGITATVADSPTRHHCRCCCRASLALLPLSLPHTHLALRPLRKVLDAIGEAVDERGVRRKDAALPRCRQHRQAVGQHLGVCVEMQHCMHLLQQALPEIDRGGGDNMGGRCISAAEPMASCTSSPAGPAKG